MVKFNTLTSVDRRMALLIFALVLALYLRTLAPGLLAGDSAEFQMAAWNWGLAHATGYPLYLLLGGLWQRLFSPLYALSNGVGWLSITPATALNAFSAVTGALAAALLYGLLARILPQPQTSQGDGVRRGIAAFAAALFAVSPTVWLQATIAEAYTLHALFVVLILLAATALGARRVGELRSIEESKAENKRRSRGERIRNSHSLFFILAFLLGLALTHHATTVLLFPALAVYLRLTRRRWRLTPAAALLALLLLALPLLLYLYIPLRSTPAASPWYHPQIGDTTLNLYGSGWPAFFDFVSGRSIAVGFRAAGELGAPLAEAARFWRVPFTWFGLLLAALGVIALARSRRWPLLALTGVYALGQQTFNLFYDIGDIFVYYIPLYLVGAIWAGFGAMALVDLPRLRGTGEPGSGEAGEQESEEEHPTGEVSNPYSLFFMLLLFLLPLHLGRTFAPRIERLQNDSARASWEEVLNAETLPADGAYLISNDRDEIVPLYYLQHVEERAPSVTGLFPGLTLATDLPNLSFVDIGATVQSALDAGDRPVYLVKPMPGLEVRFGLVLEPPLVRVAGTAINGPPAVPVDSPLGPLTLLGYDTARDGEALDLALHWRVDAPLNGDYTTTVQLFNDDGGKIAQRDQPAGGSFYPTSLWKPDEILLDRHTLSLPTNAVPARLLVGMYVGPEFQQLAPPIELAWLAN